MSDNIYHLRSPSASPRAADTDATLWLRTWSLTVGQPASAAQASVIDVGSSADSQTQGGTVLNLSDFRIVFSYEQSATNAGPWPCVMTIYNVPDQLAKQIVAQYTTVALTAGYALPQPKQDTGTTITTDAQGLPVGERSTSQPTVLPQGYKPGGSLLFSGPVIWYERGKENTTDTFLRIYASTNDQAHNLALVNAVLPAGHSQQDVVQACVDAMAQQQPGIAKGTITDLGDAKSPRGRTLYGMPRDVLRDVAQTAGGFCHIDDAGKVNILALGDPASAGPVVVVNSNTGMIGIPKQNIDGGISVITLLNPSIRPGSWVKLNQKDVTQRMLSQSFSGTSPPPGLPGQVQQVQLQQFMMQTATDGQFQVWAVTHHGDTRGNPWYSEITTRAAVPVTPKVG